MSGRVCEKHNQWCPDGVCNYCPPPRAADAEPYALSMFGIDAVAMSSRMVCDGRCAPDNCMCWAH